MLTPSSASPPGGFVAATSDDRKESDFHRGNPKRRKRRDGSFSSNIKADEINIESDHDGIDIVKTYDIEETFNIGGGKVQMCDLELVKMIGARGGKQVLQCLFAASTISGSDMDFSFKLARLSALPVPPSHATWTRMARASDSEANS